MGLSWKLIEISLSWRLVGIYGWCLNLALVLAWEWFCFTMVWWGSGWLRVLVKMEIVEILWFEPNPRSWRRWIKCGSKMLDAWGVEYYAGRKEAFVLGTMLSPCSRILRGAQSSAFCAGFSFSTFFWRLFSFWADFFVIINLISLFYEVYYKRAPLS